MAVETTQGATGDAQVDGLLSGYKWTGVISFSFPVSASDYPAYPNTTAVQYFSAVSALQRQAAINAFNLVSSYTNADFVNNGTDGSDMRIGQTSDPGTGTAYAYYPIASVGGVGGDVWFGVQYDYRNALPGNYAYATMLHEIGHALGLKHPHEAAGPARIALLVARDALLRPGRPRGRRGDRPGDLRGRPSRSFPPGTSSLPPDCVGPCSTG